MRYATGYCHECGDEIAETDRGICPYCKTPQQPPGLALPQVDAPCLARHILASMAPVQRARADQKAAES